MGFQNYFKNYAKLGENMQNYAKLHETLFETMQNYIKLLDEIIVCKTTDNCKLKHTKKDEKQQ